VTSMPDRRPHPPAQRGTWKTSRVGTKGTWAEPFGPDPPGEAGRAMGRKEQSASR